MRERKIKATPGTSSSSSEVAVPKKNWSPRMVCLNLINYYCTSISIIIFLTGIQDEPPIIVLVHRPLLGLVVGWLSSLSESSSPTLDSMQFLLEDVFYEQSLEFSSVLSDPFAVPVPNSSIPEP